jgi:hypothetical protein
MLYLIYLNYLTRYYLNLKGGYSLLLKSIDLVNFKATKLLLRPLTLNAIYSLIAPKNYSFI